MTLITAAGFRSTTGVLIVPLQDEFGWSRATISFAVSINLVFFGLGGPFAAAFVERFGMRRVITVARARRSAAGAGLSTLMTAPWQLDVLWGVVNGRRDGRDLRAARRDDREPLVRASGAASSPAC